MQRPRFKRHWDDRKWQNPINSMTESATSNMLSSAFFFSSLCVSLFSWILCLSFWFSLLSLLSLFQSFTQDLSLSQDLILFLILPSLSLSLLLFFISSFSLFFYATASFFICPSFYLSPRFSFSPL